MLNGEDDAPGECDECNVALVLQVLRSAAGYYIGTWCDCGPYSRASDYFRTREAAQAELDLWNAENVRPSGRTPGYFGGDIK